MEQQLNAVDLLAQSYYNDLEELRKMEIAIVNDNAINKLTTIAAEYDLTGKITKANFISVLGTVKRKVKSELKVLVIEKILRQVNEQNSSLNSERTVKIEKENLEKMWA
jgi:hypothetical protein